MRVGIGVKFKSSPASPGGWREVYEDCIAALELFAAEVLPWLHEQGGRVAVEARNARTG